MQAVFAWWKRGAAIVVDRGIQKTGHGEQAN